MMTKEDNNMNSLIRGTIYDPKYFRYFVNFQFLTEALNINKRLINLNDNEKNVIIPLTPDSKPVLIQILLLLRAQHLLKEGFQVNILLRDLDESARNSVVEFSKIIDIFTRKYNDNVSIISLNKIIDKKEVKSSLNKISKTDDNESIFDLLPEWSAIIKTSQHLKSSFILVGQIEAPQIIEIERLQINKGTFSTAIVYLPELWLFSRGENIFLTDSLDGENNISYKILNSWRRRYRSIHIYLLHLSVLASWIYDNGLSNKFLHLSPMDDNFYSKFNRYIIKLSNNIYKQLFNVRDKI